MRSARPSPRGAPRVLEGCALRGRSRCLTFPLRSDSSASVARRRAFYGTPPREGPTRVDSGWPLGAERTDRRVRVVRARLGLGAGHYWSSPAGPPRVFSSVTADGPPEKSRFRLNTHTTHECHLLVANSKIELADEPLTNTPRARLVERLGPAGVVRRSARAAEGTTDRAGDSASSPRRFDARGADQGTRDRDQSFGGPRPAASPGGRARGCRRL